MWGPLMWGPWLSWIIVCKCLDTSRALTDVSKDDRQVNSHDAWWGALGACKRELEDGVGEGRPLGVWPAWILACSFWTDTETWESDTTKLFPLLTHSRPASQSHFKDPGVARCWPHLASESWAPSPDPSFKVLKLCSFPVLPLPGSLWSAG